MISADELEPYSGPALAGRDGGIVRAPGARRPRCRRSSSSSPVSRRFGRPGCCSRSMTRERATYREGPTTSCRPRSLRSTRTPSPSADTNGDDALDIDELRKLIAAAPIDLTLDVDTLARGFRPGAGAGGSRRDPAQGSVRCGSSPTATSSSPIGQVRLDVHVEDGNAAAEVARRILTAAIQGRRRKQGRLPGRQGAGHDQCPAIAPCRLVGGHRPGRRRQDLPERAARVRRSPARGCARRLVVTTADQGRAIFGIVDLDRDRRLGAREVMRTVDRVMSWDGDGDGRVSADEIPYHFQVNIARSGLAGLTGEGVMAPAARSDGRNPKLAPRPARIGFRRWTATTTATSPAASSWALATSSTASTATTTA